MDYVIVPFEIKAVKEDDENYIIEGNPSVYGNIDLGLDIVESGCFYEDLKQNKDTRPILWQHSMYEPIGLGKFKENSNSLFTVINLPKKDTFVTGRVMPQVRVGSVTGLSIGYTPQEFEYDTVGDKQVRRLRRCKLHEASLVTFPMNEEARITMIKSFQNQESIKIDSKAVPSYKDYAIAKDVKWDKAKAVKQIREHTNSGEEPSKAYKNGFMYFDVENEDKYTAYKLPYVYWADGKFKAVPKALSAIVGALSGARGGIDIPDADKSKIKSQINKYYAKMDRESPFKNNITFIDKKTLECLEKRDYEKLFDDNIILSSQAKKKIVDNLNFGNEEIIEDNSFLDRLKGIKSNIDKL
jgi:HK97 family phage prohead protease